MSTSLSGLEQRLTQHGVSRRRFLKFCGVMTATLALPAHYTARVARALLENPRPPVVWLEFQDCTGDTESFLRATQRGVDELLLDLLSLDYHETLMAPSGSGTEKSLNDTMTNFPGQYIAVVEGSIPTAAGGIHCLIRGRTALSIAQEVCSGALATIALGTCAWDGGLAAASPNPTGAAGVKDAVPGLQTLISLPGCPANVVNLTTTLVHYLTFDEWPALDGQGRPRFAYHEEIHDECERHDHYEADRFVLAWGDEGHRNGWCLLKMGCKGKRTHHNCPSVKWNDGTCWPVGAGHGCVGCAEANFWDRMSPFYAPIGDDD
ncbi:hydrogenase small subunit [Chloroflexota bacterium]